MNEDRSRGNNLRLDAIKERPNETWEGCEKELDTLFKESLGIEEEVVTKRANRARKARARKVIHQELLFAEF